jgi:hypothetical protein
MKRSTLLLAAAIGWCAPLYAQDVDVAPALPATSLTHEAPAPAADSSVAPFYAAHPGTLLWLRDADSKAAAAKLVDILKRAPIDGLADGPVLASSVETALASGTPADDQIISTAWVRYAQAIERPVEGISYGDSALRLKPESASAILEAVLAAPSLAVLLDQVSSVNPLYAALRDDAVSSGQQDDPHVRSTLDRLRLIPAKGRAILVDVANAQLMMLQDGEAVDTMKVIVGKPTFPTPLLAGKIWYVTFNPYWHIPQDVAKRKVAPIVLKRGVAYLKAAKYQTVAAFGGDKEQPIDPRAKTVTLSRFGSTQRPPGVAIPLLFAEDAPLIAGSYRSHRGDFMLDTGNAGPTIIEDYWARPLGLSPALDKGVPRGDTKVSKATVGLGPFERREELVSYYGPAERGSEYSRAVAGVYGEPLLSRFKATYDYSRGTVWLEPLPDVGPFPFDRSGLSFAKADGGTLKVSAVMAGSPADEAGIKAGDVISTIGGTASARLSRADAADILRGKPGASVTLGGTFSGVGGSKTLILRDLVGGPS